MRKTIRQVGDSIFDKRLSQLATKYPYQSFVVMSAALEFLGKCYNKCTDFQKDGNSKTFCNKVIESLSSLKEYRKFDNLYHNLRCGMLHSFVPDGIILCRKKNNVEDNIIGAQQFCEDLKKAWEELKRKPELMSFVNKTDVLTVNGVLSGDTPTETSQELNV